MSLKRLLAGVFGSMAIAGSSMFAQDASLYTELEPTTIFSGGVQYLVMRATANSRPPPRSSTGRIRPALRFRTPTSVTDPEFGAF